MIDLQFFFRRHSDCCIFETKADAVPRVGEHVTIPLKDGMVTSRVYHVTWNWINAETLIVAVVIK